MRVYVRNTPASKPRTKLIRTACKVTWSHGPVHAPLTLSPGNTLESVNI